MPTTKADAEKLVEMAKALPLPLKLNPLIGGWHIIDGSHEHAMPLVEVVNAAPQLAADYIALLEAIENRCPTCGLGRTDSANASAEVCPTCGLIGKEAFRPLPGVAGL